MTRFQPLGKWLCGRSRGCWARGEDKQWRITKMDATKKVSSNKGARGIPFKKNHVQMGRRMKNPTTMKKMCVISTPPE